MGRRFLRPVDANFDLSTHLLKIEDLTPWDPNSLFQRTAPVEIEVGSGKGLFITGAAIQQPDHDFLGVEIARKYAKYSAGQLAKHELDNARMMTGDANPLFHEVLPDDVVHAVHIYFPDPWWKKRHHKRRIMNVDFLRQVHRVLMPSGTLHFWTDVEDYYLQSLELIRDSDALPFEGPFDVPEKEAEHDLDYRTHFERRTRIHEEPVYRCQFKKASN